MCLSDCSQIIGGVVCVCMCLCVGGGAITAVRRGRFLGVKIYARKHRVFFTPDKPGHITVDISCT